mmetsp:Transcript_37306/g.73404  ORF Transcript_37306/g.73404 Transcript_37306/m.73404 type:complete len:305 (+) Transcript_37306:231-1145(+)
MQPDRRSPACVLFVVAEGSQGLGKALHEGVRGREGPGAQIFQRVVPVGSFQIFGGHLVWVVPCQPLPGVFFLPLLIELMKLSHLGLHASLVCKEVQVLRRPHAHSASPFLLLLLRTPCLLVYRGLIHQSRIRMGRQDGMPLSSTDKDDHLLSFLLEGLHQRQKVGVGGSDDESVHLWVCFEDCWRVCHHQHVGGSFSGTEMKLVSALDAKLLHKPTIVSCKSQRQGPVTVGASDNHVSQLESLSAEDVGLRAGDVLRVDDQSPFLLPPGLHPGLPLCFLRSLSFLFLQHCVSVRVSIVYWRCCL